MWCVAAHLHPASNHVDRVSSYPNYESFLSFENIDFPIKISDIKHFEEINKISVNVYGFEGDQIVGPLHLTKDKQKTHVNLLFVENEK